MPLPRLVVTSAFLAGLALASASAWADRLDATVALGGAAVPATVGPDGDIASVGFVVSGGPGKKLQCTIKASKGSSLKPVVTMIAPDGTPFVPESAGGSIKKTATSWVLKLADIPAGKSGLWRMEVSGEAGTSGAFTCQIKGKDGSAVSVPTVVVPANGQVFTDFEAGQNTAVTITVKRAKGSNLTPQIQIIDAGGAGLANGAFLGTSSSKSGVASLKSYRLPTSGKYKLRVTGKDGAGGTVGISIKTAPAKIKGTLPTANAGGVSLEAEQGLEFTLDGSASTGKGGTLTYSWVQIGGPIVTLTGPRTAKPKFNAPTLTGTNVSASLAFELAVFEDAALSRSVPVTVEVGRRPIADAGRAQSVAVQSVVTLDGSASLDRRKLGLEYAWTQVAGTSVTLSNPKADKPTFTAPNTAAVLKFALVVDDGNLRSAADEVVVSVGDPARPVADAGRNQVVTRMATVQLNGLASITASGLLDAPVAWTKISGPDVTIVDADTPLASFTAPKVNTELTFELRVNGDAATADRVTVTVRQLETNTAPVGRGSGQMIASPGNVDMSGATSTDLDPGTTLRYRWGQIAGAALRPANPDNAVATIALPAGNAFRAYAFVPNDGLANGTPDTVTVRNTGYTGQPLANAGFDPPAANAGLPITLDGSASLLTQGSGPLTYAWRQVTARDWFDVDASDAGFDPAAQKPVVRVPSDVSSLTSRRTITFELVVNDGTVDSAPDFVTATITGLQQNGKPTVDVTASTTNPIAGAVVNLTATTFDRDGDEVTVTWSQVSGPSVVLSAPAPQNPLTSKTPSFIAPNDGVVVLSCQPKDAIEFGTSDTISVDVDAAPAAAIQISPTSGQPGTFCTVTSTGTSDPEAQPLIYTWTTTHPDGLPVGFPDQSNTGGQFNAPSGGITLRLQVNDGRQNSNVAVVSFSEGAPIAHNPVADKSNAAYGATVTLNSNASGGIGTFGYTWRQINSGADPTVTLSSLSAANPTFTVPSPTSLGFGAAPSATFGLIVTSGTATSSEKNVKVTFFASLANKAGDTTLPNNSQIYNGIIAGTCATASCHSGTKNSCPVGTGSGYGMGSAAAFRTNSVGSGSCSSSKKRIDTTPANSYLVDRLKGIGGSQMPTGGSLTTAQIRLIEDWIDQGAQDN